MERRQFEQKTSLTEDKLNRRTIRHKTSWLYNMLVGKQVEKKDKLVRRQFEQKTIWTEDNLDRGQVGRKTV